MMAYAKEFAKEHSRSINYDTSLMAFAGDFAGERECMFGLHMMLLVWKHLLGSLLVSTIHSIV